MCEIMAVTGGKGGVGKTTVSINIAKTLADRGMKVLLIDCDFGLCKLDMLLDHYETIEYDVVDILNNKCDTADAFIDTDGRQKLFLLVGSKKLEKRPISVEDFNILIRMYKPMFDFIVVDCPAGIDTGFELAMSAADRALVVVGKDMSALSDASKVVNILHDRNIDYDIVINFMDTYKKSCGYNLSVDDIESVFKKAALAIIPTDVQVQAFMNSGEEISKKSVLGKHISNLVDRIISPDCPRLEYKPTLRARLRALLA